MRQRLRWVVLILLITGCQQESGKVLERLPDPVYADRQPSPAPQVVPAPAPSVPVIPHEPGWLPAKGISNRWQCIVVHHTASDLGSLKDIDAWHRAKGWDGCGYHFVIGNGTRSSDGTVEPSYRWRAQSHGAHTRLPGRQKLGYENYYNEHGIGLVLVGHFDKDRPTARQMDSTVRLVRFLMAACNIPANRVYTHGDLKATDCPGRNFPDEEFRRRLKALQ